jgi:hypothetical protein
MNHLGKNHHFNIDVRKWGSNFVKCIVCASLKDLISKIERIVLVQGNMKLNLKSRTFTMNLVDVFILFGKHNQFNPNNSTCASFMTR